MATPGGLTPLGTGPAAVVYAAGDAVLKVFPGPVDRRTRAAWERENGRWAGVPGVRPVHGVEVTGDGRFAVRAERCPYSLAERVRRDGPLPVGEVVALGRALASTVAAAHAAGLVHGSITPHNVLFRATGEPVLADGGLVPRGAFPVDPPAETAAPETIRDAVRDAATDFHGLGAVLFHALTGHPPHPKRLGEGTEEHVLRVLGEPPPEVERPDVPLGLAKLVHGLLAANPGARPRDVTAALDVLGPATPPIANPAAPPVVAPATPSVLGPATPLDPGPTVPVPRPTGGRVQVAEAKPDHDRSGRLGLLGGIAAALALFGSAPFLLLRDDPPTPSAQPPPVSAPRTSAEIEVVELVDNRDHVRITWRGPDLDYLVIIAPEGRSSTRSAESRERTAHIPVEPGLKYCFEVHGTNGRETHRSKPQSIREAKCVR